MSDITAEDREAAEYYGKAVGYPDNDPTGDILRTAFARHRIAAEQRGRLMGLEEAEKLWERRKYCGDFGDAIRKLKDQGHG